MKSFPAIFAAVLAFIMLLIFPYTAKDAVISGMKTCGEIIIPSLFPFFVAVNLIVELGVIARLFKNLRINSIKYAAFIIGVTGGYPVGAAFIAETRSRGEISREDASKLLVYCNNSGPAFIIGAVGAGVFDKASVGLILYAAHILSALIYGRLFCRTENNASQSSTDVKFANFSAALTASVKKSVNTIINVCGFVLAFSVLIKMLNSDGLIMLLSGKISELLHTELHYNSALISGIFEIGNSISQMRGLKANPSTLSLAAFILGWGGISVHFQTFSIVSDTDIKTARYIIGRFLIAVLGAIIAYIAALVFRI